MSTALVIGGAACVWKDVEAALELGEFDAVVACNDIGAAWPGPLDGWVSLHAEKMGLWAARRVANGHPHVSATYGHSGGHSQFVANNVEFRLPGQKSTGSSGLFALKVALVDLGHDKAVLCGIPLAPEQGHFFDTATWRAARSYRQGWQEARAEIQHRARSMSGWTAELLGQPDTEWLGS